jgi:AdoMet-dependent rRNA methyltransferase SPB1
MWVFNQFFKTVNATKPAASRNESAEIFVVCLGYKAPDKIDPKFLDARHVFSEVETIDTRANELLNPEKKKKAPAEGYEVGQTLLYKRVKASEFISDDKPIQVLNNCHEIFLDLVKIKKHPKTTQEIVECCKDIRVLGMKELRLLKKWREILKADFELADKEKAKKEAEKAKLLAENGETGETEEKAENTDEDDEDLEVLDKEINDLQEEERKLEKRKKKRSLKEKRKIAERINLKMILPGDEGPTKIEEGLFKISEIKSAKSLAQISETAPDIQASDSEDEEDGVPKVNFKKK